MPEEYAYWIVSVPLEGDESVMQSSVSTALGVPPSGVPTSTSACTGLGALTFPNFKIGTLQSLITLNEELPKHDTAMQAAVAKIVDTLRNLVNQDETQLRAQQFVGDVTPDEYVLGGWSWNESKYRVGERSLADITDSLAKDVQSIDNVMKQRLADYNAAKSQLLSLQRKKTGSLAVRSLADIVSKDDFVDPSSEYLETLLVAVPKTGIKHWLNTYETLSKMIVPRSSRKIAEDEEFGLFNITIFRKYKNDFLQKARENKYVVREFQWDDHLAERQAEDLEDAAAAEKELWTELLRLSKINFGEAYEGLMHLKVLRAFVESVLRYGLPANFFTYVIKPSLKKGLKPLVTALNQEYKGLSRRGHKATDTAGSNETPGEFASLLEEDWTPYVLMELPLADAA